MDSTIHTSYNAADRSYFSILKKGIHNIAVEAGFSASRTGEVDIVVAEMASNLIKHAGGGEILVRYFADDTGDAIELISIDNGPGIADPAKVVEDGMSTANTLGHGLGSIKRISDTFQIYSLKGWGTIVLARIYKRTPKVPVTRNQAEVRALVVAKPGETVSGDGFAAVKTRDMLKMFLGDGLGHGEEAHAAIAKAAGIFKESEELAPVELLRQIHTGVKKTRGLVGTVAVYSFKQKQWQVCGVGNIATRSQMQQLSKTHMSYNGILGMNIPNSIKEHVINYERGHVLIMCSDGIRSRWELQKYTGIFRYDLSVLAAAIYKDYGRRTDDMSVLISRIIATV